MYTTVTCIKGYHYLFIIVNIESHGSAFLIEDWENLQLTTYLIVKYTQLKILNIIRKSVQI